MKSRKFLSCLLAAGLLAGCGGSSNSTGGKTDQPGAPEAAASEPAAEEPVVEEEHQVIAAMSRPTFFEIGFTEGAGQTASAEDYTVAPDLSNVVNIGAYYLPDPIRNALADKYFAVVKSWEDEFFDIYESNMYGERANYITVDSLLHTFHLYYAYLQKNCEKQYFLQSLKDVTQNLLTISKDQLETLKGTEWESAARRNAEYFAVAAELLGMKPEFSDPVTQEELVKIEQEGGIARSALMTVNEEYLQDYSQFKPRGYYTESEDLQKYFRTMMWYGQMNFTAKEEDHARSALLMNLALNGDAFAGWEQIYAVTSFFSGESDDHTYYEYYPVIQTAYGEDVSIDDLAGNTEAFETYFRLCQEMDPPQINSIVLIQNPDGEDTVEERNEKTNGFRLMGQRFTIDASVMQRLVYREVKENSSGAQRLLPSALDVPAAFGSDAALDILKETGVEDYPGYMENMEKLRESIASGDDKMWSASIYSAWLNTLRPLLETKGAGYPKFMQSQEWTKKNLISFLGSYAELKHDSILYAKQVMAEMGGAGFMESYDDRGYVEPEPEVFGRLAALSRELVRGLQDSGMISDVDAEYMGLFSELAEKLQVIAEKELRNELPSDEEFELIRSYGGQLEHLWTRTIGDNPFYASNEHPSPIVADIATDPNGTCLEIGTGKPATIYVLTYFDGGVHLCSGTMYTFYEFEQPISDRLTDEAWREKLSDWNNPPATPAWTDSFYTSAY